MHNYVLYYLLLLPLSHLPLPVLHRLSDLLYLLLYRALGYRKTVVRGNIQRSFPNNADAENLRIEREFFKHFCDLLVESVKAFTISEPEARERFTTKNPELPNLYFEQGKSIAIVGGHYGNWELLAITIARQIKHTPVALYTSMTNEFFDRKMKATRSRYGLNLIPLKRYRDVGIADFENELTATIFGSDQSPRRSQRAYWVDFLNQDTAVQFGLEKFARAHNVPVIYGEIHKLRRGYYRIEYRLVCEDPSELPEGRITERHTRMLENIIIEHPDHWLWSHRRWKLEKPDDAEVHSLSESVRDGS